MISIIHIQATVINHWTNLTQVAAFNPTFQTTGPSGKHFLMCDKQQLMLNKSLFQSV